ncbi:hypothetical protein [Bacillus pumilus]
MGGGKVKDKMGVIESVVDKVEKVMMGGGVGFG